MPIHLEAEMRRECMRWLMAAIVIATLETQGRAQTPTQPPATAPTSQPAKPKRERDFSGGQNRPPIIWAGHIGDEHFMRLCDDLGLDETARTMATSLHQQYIAPLQTRAEQQEQERHEWHLKTEAELAPEIVIPEGKTLQDLPQEQQTKWFEQQRLMQMGQSRAYHTPGFVLRLNDFSYEQSMAAMRLEAGHRSAFLEQLRAALPAASVARWERAMNLLAINLATEFERHPRAMISDPPSRLGLHEVVRGAATSDDGELHGLVDLPGLATEAATAAQMQAIERLDMILREYEIQMAALLDEDPIRLREARHAAAQAFNRGEFELSRAMEAQVRNRSRSKYSLRIGTARAIGEFLKDVRGDDAARTWNDRFDAAQFPALHFRDSVDEMHDWLVAGEIALDEAQRQAIEKVYSDYVDARRGLRQRIMPLLVDLSCDPNAVVSLANGDQHSARAVVDKAQEERTPLAKVAHANMRGVLDSESQARFDEKREAVRRALLNSLAQPAPP